MKRWINENTTDKAIEILTLLLILFLGYIIFQNNAYGLKTFDGGDIQRGFKRGIDILNGVNPYLEFNPEQLLIQEKVPGFFPLYFYLMAFVAKISNYSFVQFIDNIRYLVFISYSAVGLLVYFNLRENGRSIALLGMIIFMFNRWTLEDALSLKQDTYVIAILMCSMLLLNKNKYLAFFLLGVATAIKHLTILAFPIFALELIVPFLNLKKDFNKTTLVILMKQVVICSIFLLLPIIGPAIPYLMKTPKHMTYAILFNITREGESTSSRRDTGFNKLLVHYNQDRNNDIIYYMLPRLPFIITLAILVYALFTRKVGIWRYCAFAYLIFVGFNPVLFGQYYTWLMAFIPFAAVETNAKLDTLKQT